MVDVFHTLFGVAGKFSERRVIAFVTALLLLNHVAGLSILGYPGLVDLDPVYCMPVTVIENKGLRKDWQALDRRQL